MTTFNLAASLLLFIAETIRLFPIGLLSRPKQSLRRGWMTRSKQKRGSRTRISFRPPVRQSVYIAPGGGGGGGGKSAGSHFHHGPFQKKTLTHRPARRAGRCAKRQNRNPTIKLRESRNVHATPAKTASGSHASSYLFRCAPLPRRPIA